MAKCDICKHVKHRDPVNAAVYDGRTILQNGIWANMCQECFDEYGCGLGTGLGSKLEEDAEPERVLIQINLDTLKLALSIFTGRLLSLLDDPENTEVGEARMYAGMAVSVSLLKILDGQRLEEDAPQLVKGVYDMMSLAMIQASGVMGSGPGTRPEEEGHPDTGCFSDSDDEKSHTHSEEPSCHSSDPTSDCPQEQPQETVQTGGEA